MPFGTPITAPLDWQVIERGSNALSGKFVRVRFADGSEHSFSHLSASPNVDSGRAGQPIAVSGKDADDKNGHLHTRTWVDGKEIDPAQYYGRGKKGR